MKIEPFLVSLTLFVFSVFLFPDLEHACSNVNQSLTLAPLIQRFPWILIVIMLLPPIYYLFKKGEN